jgi:hypothetical protein
MSLLVIGLNLKPRYLPTKRRSSQSITRVIHCQVDARGKKMYHLPPLLTRQRDNVAHQSNDNNTPFLTISCLGHLSVSDYNILTSFVPSICCLGVYLSIPFWCCYEIRAVGSISGSEKFHGQQLTSLFFLLLIHIYFSDTAFSCLHSKNNIQWESAPRRSESPESTEPDMVPLFER